MGDFGRYYGNGLLVLLFVCVDCESSAMENPMVVSERTSKEKNTPSPSNRATWRAKSNATHLYVLSLDTYEKSMF